MITRGLLVRLEARHDKHEALEEFLRSALPLVLQEPATIAWFAVRFGRSEYGIFDVFPDETGRDTHLSGAVAAALSQRSGELFARAPQIEKVDILADKLPLSATLEQPKKGLLLTFKAKSDHIERVEDFLRSARQWVEQEPKTTAWFAVRFARATYGIFDVFPDQSARFSHLTGHVPRELTKHAFSLLGSLPDMHMLDVLAEKISVEVGV
jgi:quinol monooxygenase YgiN